MSLTSIDYDRVLASAPSRDPASLREFLAEELPFVWLATYGEMLPHQHNVHRVKVEGFEYLWDFSSELVKHGVVRPSEAIDDRLIAAHGVSRRNLGTREKSRLGGRTLGAVDVVHPSQRVPYDRGHAIGHVLGGVLDLNIIPQSRAVNRDGTWRRMERYCHHHPGTYFFCRLLYVGLYSHAAEIEFGVLREEGSLWVNRFKNYGRIEEIEEFERLYREKMAELERTAALSD